MARSSKSRRVEQVATALVVCSLIASFLDTHAADEPSFESIFGFSVLLGVVSAVALSQLAVLLQRRVGEARGANDGL